MDRLENQNENQAQSLFDCVARRELLLVRTLLGTLALAIATLGAAIIAVL
jgi:hypothetical protein